MSRLLCWVWLPLSLMSLYGTPLKADALRWQWTVGEVYNIKFTSNVALAVSSDSDRLNYQNKIIVSGQWTVAEVNSSGIARLHWQVQRVEINPIAKDGQLKIDTDVKAETPEEATLQATLRGLLQKRFELVVNNTARLSSVKELRQDSKAPERLSSEKPARLGNGNLPQLFDSGGVARAFKHVFIQFPSDSIKSGDTWQPTLPLNTPEPKEMPVYKYLGVDGSAVSGRSPQEPKRPQIVFTPKIYFDDSDQADVEVKRQAMDGKIYINTAERFVEKVVIELALETITSEDGKKIDVLHEETHLIELKKLLR